MCYESLDIPNYLQVLLTNRTSANELLVTSSALPFTSISVSATSYRLELDFSPSGESVSTMTDALESISYQNTDNPTDIGRRYIYITVTDCKLT